MPTTKDTKAEEKAAAEVAAEEQARRDTAQDEETPPQEVLAGASPSDLVLQVDGEAIHGNAHSALNPFTGAFRAAPEPPRPDRTILAEPPPPPAEPVYREVTQDDLDSPGYQCLNNSGQVMFEHLVLRPGDRVIGPVEVFGLHDLATRIAIYPGGIVPDDDSGYVPTNYVMERPRQRVLAGKK